MSEEKQEINLLTTADIADICGVNLYRIINLVNDPNIKVPETTFNLGGSPCWEYSTLDQWEELVAQDINKRNQVSITKGELIDKVLEKAKDVERSAKYAYKRSRYNSISSVKQRIIELEALYRFVSTVTDNPDLYYWEKGLIEPVEIRREIQTLISKAKSHVGME